MGRLGRRFFGFSGSTQRFLNRRAFRIRRFRFMRLQLICLGPGRGRCLSSMAGRFSALSRSLKAASISAFDGSICNPSLALKHVAREPAQSILPVGKHFLSEVIFHEAEKPNRIAELTEIIHAADELQISKGIAVPNINRGFVNRTEFRPEVFRHAVFPEHDFKPFDSRFNVLLCFFKDRGLKPSKLLGFFFGGDAGYDLRNAEESNVGARVAKAQDVPGAVRADRHIHRNGGLRVARSFLNAH